MQQSLLNF